MLNILEEPMLRYRNCQEEPGIATLPGIYSLLEQDDVESFHALCAHQRHAWHAFLVQLAAAAMLKAGTDQLPQAPDDWRSLLRGLTQDWPDDSPWQLVVDDITLPGFMQPHATDPQMLSRYQNFHLTPDSIDTLQTSKNHHVKSRIAVQAQPDNWIMALVSAQTMSGFTGPGSYGISRMNRGFASRPCFSLAPAHGGLGAHVMRDITALLEARPLMLERYPQVNGPNTLIWTMPWDGALAEMLYPEDLDPFYIDCARLLRLYLNSQGQLEAWRATSKTNRIEVKNTLGRTGDPWTPVDLEREGRPLTLPEQGFDYERIANCFTGENWQHPVLLKPTRQEQQDGVPMKLVARCLMRTRGGTKGYSEQQIPLRETLTAALYDPQVNQEAGEIARDRIKQVRTTRYILQDALLTFMTNASKDVGRKRSLPRAPKERCETWLKHLDHQVNQTFMHDLQLELETPPEDREKVRIHWLMNGHNGLIDHALDILAQGQEALSCQRNRFYPAQAQSDMIFQRRLQAGSGFPFLFNPETRQDQKADAKETAQA